MRTDGQADMMKQLVALRNFEKAPKIRIFILKANSILVILVTSNIFIRCHVNIHIFIHTLSQNHYTVRKSTRVSISVAESRHTELAGCGENSELISTLKGVTSL